MGREVCPSNWLLEVGRKACPAAITTTTIQGIIAVASLLATMALYGNGRDPQ